MGGLLDVIVGAGATIGKIFGAVSSIVGQKNAVTYSFQDKVTGDKKLLVGTGLSIAGGEFIVERNQSTGTEMHEIFNTSADNNLLVTRSNVDEVNDDYAGGETLQIPATQKIVIDGFYDNEHYPLETVIELTPQKIVSAFDNSALNSDHATYTARFKNIPVGGPDMKSGSYFQLTYKDGKFIFVNSMVPLLGVSYFEVTSHNGVYFQNASDIPVSLQNTNYEMAFDLLQYGVKNGDMIDVAMTVVIETSASDTLLKKQRIQPEAFNANDLLFLSQLRGK
ncbi:hypothetical protein QMA56_05870 [Leuconostoc falkenbergense]|uniref:hypothetical protein n=1 Tax=Leuconostoc falkenbergense TaxID=2766470 RepID=UPI0024ADA2B9|nr:hypothetical protein [Leuconostoc falkenbergense]MDI6667237.1 hypothetical protein [Leuconostoc falkenbergense]